MGKANFTGLFGFFVAIIVVLCGASLLKGGFYIGKHEGDTYHLLQIVLRMAEGQVPHLDFMTPIGVLAFAPISFFVSLGFGVGASILLAQTLVAIVFLPALFWVAFSRLRGPLPYFFGFVVLVLISALVHGEAQGSVSISMHYNRWSWAAAFIAISAAVLPSIGAARPRVDGVIIGLALAFLMLTKITYFAAFSIPIVVALLARRSAGTLIMALISGASALAVVTLIYGPTYWLAYFGNVLTVAGSDFRAFPGEPIGAVVGAPAYIGASLLLVGGVVLLRQSGKAVGGLSLLLLTPGFFYVTYQNFGNDPQWLLLLAVLLLASLPAADTRNGLGWDMRNAVRVTAFMALAMAAPSFFNLVFSPFRHLAADVTEYTQLLPKSEQHSDIYTTNIRAARTNIQVPLVKVGSAFDAYTDLADDAELSVFKGEVLPHCELLIGLTAWFDVIVTDLDQAGFTQGKGIFAADLFSSHWLFGNSVPLKGGSPWYYGGLPGLSDADYLLVPLCPILPGVRQQILAEIEATDLEFSEIHRTSLYILFEPAKG